MTRQEAIDWIKSQNSDTEFAISFYKADGSLRIMKARFGFNDGTLVNNPLKIGKKKPEGQVTVYDVNKKEYRAFKEDKLVGLDQGQGWVKIDET